MAKDSNKIIELKNQLLREQEKLLRDIKELEESVDTSGEEAVVEQAKAELEILQLRRDTLISNLEIERQILQTKQANNEATEAEKELLQEIDGLIEKAEEEAQKAIKTQKNQLKLLEKDEELNKKIKNNILGVVKADEMRLVGLTRVWNVSKNLNSMDAFATLVARLQEVGAFVIGLAEQFNQLSAELNRTTNTAGKFDSAVINIAASNIRLGISAQDAAKSIGTLYEDFNSFTNLSSVAQEDLAGFTSQMEKAGISAQTTAKFLNTATRSMGMGVEEVKKFEKELFAFSRANGISMKAINDGLGTVMPRLAAFGKDAPKIFKNLAFEAKQMGVEMGKLLDVTEKFTTFEGAAEAVGELNSVLGGNYLDSLEMLRAASDDPVKAQEMLRDALQKTGKSFDELTGQQRRMFASMLGTDMDTAAGFFRQTSQEAKEAAMNEEAFNEAVAAFTPIGEKMKNLFAAMGPVIKVVSDILGFFVDIIASFVQSKFGIFILSIVAGFGALVAGITALVGIVATIIGSFGLFYNVLKNTGTIFKTIKDGVSNAGEGIKNFSEKVSDSMGSISNIIKKTAGSVGSGFKTLMRGIGAGFAAFGNAIKSLANPQVAIGVLVLLGVAAAFWIIAQGLKAVLEGLVPLVKLLIDAGTEGLVAAVSLIGIAAAIYILSSSLMALATIGSVGLLVLAGLVVAFLGLGASFLMIGEGMSKAKDGIDAIANLDLTKLEKMRDIMAQMATHMSLLGASAVIFSQAMSNPIMAPIVASVIGPAPATATTTSAGFSPKATTNTTQQNTSNNTITVKIDSPIMLDKKEVGRFVVEKIAQLSQSDGNTQASPVVTTGRVTI